MGSGRNEHSRVSGAQFAETGEHTSHRAVRIHERTAARQRSAFWTTGDTIGSRSVPRIRCGADMINA